MTVLLMDGDAVSRLRELPDNSVHCCVTSPPYFGLRSYGIGAENGEIGLEETPEAFVSGLVAVFQEVRRVLRKDGTCWINIGDGYAQTGSSGPNSGLAKLADKWAPRTNPRNPNRDDTGEVPRAKTRTLSAGTKHKDLIGVPWMLAFALRADGWYLRSSVIWSKSSCMPESVKDRPSSSREDVFMLTKTDRYFYDDFAVSEESSPNTNSRISTAAQLRGAIRVPVLADPKMEVAGSGVKNNNSMDAAMAIMPARRNLRNVWFINPEPLKIKHFAAFPTRLASRCIQASTSEAGCCRACGAPFRRLVEKGAPDAAHMAACGADSTGVYAGEPQKDYDSAGAQNASDTKRRILEGMRTKVTVGWEATCTCNALGQPVPAIVLDPFSGAGTTALAATRLGRDAIGIDLNGSYNDLAATRLRDEKAKCLDTNGVRLPFRATVVSRS